MMRRFVLALAIGVMAAGSVRAGSIDVDFNPNAEFEKYKTWAWIPDRDKGHHGVLADLTMRERVEKALAIRLREAGLTEAGPSATPDVLVRYQGDIGQGKTGTTSVDSAYYWTDPAYASVEFTEQTATLIVDLVDASTKALAWRLYIHHSYGGPSDPPNRMRDALDKGFAKYPPSASARAKKARKLAKESGAK
jgi:hypothetical protein